MKIKLKVLLLILVVVMVSSLAACSNEGEAEKAGKKIDKVFNSAKDKINDVTK